MADAILGYEQAAEQVAEALARFELAQWQRPDLARSASEILRRRRRLLTGRTASKVLAAAQDASGGEPERARRARQLSGFLLECRLRERLSGHLSRIAAIEVKEMVRARGDQVPFGSLRGRLAGEPDRELRIALRDAADGLLAGKVNSHLIDALDERARECSDLGFDDPSKAWGWLNGVETGRLERQCRELLDATASRYRELLDAAAEGEGLDPGQLHPADLPRLTRCDFWDEGLSAERLSGTYAATMAGLGIDIWQQEAIRLDIDPDGELDRAFCIGTEIPGKVHLVMSPSGGWNDYFSLMHEAGHAQHLAGTSAELDFPARMLGDRSVGEGWASLLDRLTGEPEWLVERTGVRDPAPFTAQSLFNRMLMLRRYCALTLFELEQAREWGGHDRLERRARFAELLTDAVGVPASPDGWLYQPSTWFYSAAYVRGWMLAAHWRGHLRDRFGPSWFGEREAGEWLRSGWLEGQRLNAEELLKKTIGAELTTQPLLDDLLGADRG